MQKLLPRLRARRMAEQRIVIAAAKPVVAGTDVHTPAARKVIGRVQLGQTIALSDNVSPITR